MENRIVVESLLIEKWSNRFKELFYLGTDIYPEKSVIEKSSRVPTHRHTGIRRAISKYTIWFQSVVNPGDRAAEIESRYVL
jgi:hypothetical protein